MMGELVLIGVGNRAIFDNAVREPRKAFGYGVAILAGLVLMLHVLPMDALVAIILFGLGIGAIIDYIVREPRKAFRYGTAILAALVVLLGVVPWLAG
jgi:hypothetical protein